MITKIFGTHDANTLAQLENVATRADRVALMADGHLGYIMPIGGVAAYRNKVSVTGVGFDIACGNAAILTDLSIDHIEESIIEIADTIHSTISFGIGRNNKCGDAPIDDGFIAHLHPDYKYLHEEAKLSEEEIEILIEINKEIK